MRLSKGDVAANGGAYSGQHISFSAMACYDGMAGCARDNECAGKETRLFVAQMAVDSIISEPCGQRNLAEYALNTIH